MKPIQFELKKVIKYAGGSEGGEIEANFIELREPTGKQSHICCEIESLIQAGAVKMAGFLDEETINEAKANAKEQAEKNKDDDDLKMDVESVMAIMTGGGVEMKKVVLYFRDLFKEVAFMGGEKALTTPRMDEMSHHDFRKMMGVYAANFILR